MCQPHNIFQKFRLYSQVVGRFVKNTLCRFPLKLHTIECSKYVDRVLRKNLHSLKTLFVKIG